MPEGECCTCVISHMNRSMTIISCSISALLHRGHLEICIGGFFCVKIVCLYHVTAWAFQWEFKRSYLDILTCSQGRRECLMASCSTRQLIESLQTTCWNAPILQALYSIIINICLQLKRVGFHLHWRKVFEHNGDGLTVRFLEGVTSRLSRCLWKFKDAGLSQTNSVFHSYYPKHENSTGAQCPYFCITMYVYAPLRFF